MRYAEIVKDWIAKHCVGEPEARYKFKTMYENFRKDRCGDWVPGPGEFGIGRKVFSQILRNDLGYQMRNVGGYFWVIGVRKTS